MIWSSTPIRCSCAAADGSRLDKIIPLRVGQQQPVSEPLQRPGQRKGPLPRHVERVLHEEPAAAAKAGQTPPPGQILPVKILSGKIPPGISEGLPVQEDLHTAYDLQRQPLPPHLLPERQGAPSGSAACAPPRPPGGTHPGGRWRPGSSRRPPPPAAPSQGTPASCPARRPHPARYGHADRSYALSFLPAFSAAAAPGPVSVPVSIAVPVPPVAVDPAVFRTAVEGVAGKRRPAARSGRRCRPGSASGAPRRTSPRRAWRPRTPPAAPHPGNISQGGVSMITKSIFSRISSTKRCTAPLVSTGTGCSMVLEFPRKYSPLLRIFPTSSDARFPPAATSCRLCFPPMPRRAASVCRRRSPSMSSTFRPSSARRRARLTATVDFPSPAAVLVTTSTFCPACSICRSRRSRRDRMLSPVPVGRARVQHRDALPLLAPARLHGHVRDHGQAAQARDPLHLLRIPGRPPEEGQKPQDEKAQHKPGCAAGSQSTLHAHLVEGRGRRLRLVQHLEPDLPQHEAGRLRVDRHRRIQDIPGILRIRALHPRWSPRWSSRSSPP